MQLVIEHWNLQDSIGQSKFYAHLALDKCLICTLKCFVFKQSSLSFADGANLCVLACLFSLYLCQLQIGSRRQMC